MRFSVRPYLMAGVGIVAAGSIAIPPSVAPPNAAPRQQNVVLAAHAEPVNPLLRQPGFATTAAAAALLPADALTSTEAMTATLDAAAAEVSALALPGLESAIINAYDVIMPWVDWGVNLGIYATQWIPIVNWFTPQISIFYYSLIRPIITSAVFNVAYWVGGQISFGQGLANFFNESVDAGIGFVNAEIDWLLSFLPPFPPFPPFFSSVSQSVMEVAGARTAVQVPAGVGVALADDEAEKPAEPTDETTEPSQPETVTPGETAAETAPADTEVEPETPETPKTPADPEQTPVEETDTEPQDEVDSADPDAVPEDEDAEKELDEKPADTKPDTDEDADADQDADITKPGTVQDGTKPDTKPDTKSDSKPDTKKDSGSGSED